MTNKIFRLTKRAGLKCLKSPKEKYKMYLSRLSYLFSPCCVLVREIIITCVVGGFWFYWNESFYWKGMGWMLNEAGLFNPFKIFCVLIQTFLYSSSYFFFRAELSGQTREVITGRITVSTAKLLLETSLNISQQLTLKNQRYWKFHLWNSPTLQSFYMGFISLGSLEISNII